MTIELAANGLPQSSEWLFPEYDFEAMNVTDYAGVVIERILERGSWAEIRWLLDSYGKPRIAAWVSRHGYRLLDPRAFHYWRWMLGVAEYRVPPWVQAK